MYRTCFAFSIAFYIENYHHCSLKIIIIVCWKLSSLFDENYHRCSVKIIIIVHWKLSSLFIENYHHCSLKIIIIVLENYHHCSLKIITIVRWKLSSLFVENYHHCSFHQKLLRRQSPLASKIHLSGVFRSLLNINAGVFCGNSSWLKAINYFCEKAAT